jgi:septal ring factor EnvC (AmiA/AmiB activator)
MTALSETASPLSGLVDETRLGSAGGQLAIGIAGIVLAVILVMGQITLATTSAIAQNLNRSVVNITEANKVMESVIERAAPSTQLEKIVAVQSKTLANTRDAMIATNAQMDEISASTTTLDAELVAQMQQTSEQLAANVAAMQTSTDAIVSMLGTLPEQTEKTQTALDQLNSDTAQINAQLAQINKKLQGYGLPKAQGTPTP